MQTIAQPKAVGTLTFTEALQQVSELARTKLPSTLQDRLGRAVTLVESGHVWLEEDGQHAAVQSLDDARWHAVNSACDCQDAAYRAEGGLCQHRLAVGLVRRAQELMHKPVILPEDEAAPSGIAPRFIVTIQGRPFVRFAGLLQMAQERGLVSVTVEWTYNDAELPLAHAVAAFTDGRRFEDSGDATPANTTKKVALHFRRVALTRASARALRLALGLDLVAVEELADE